MHSSPRRSAAEARALTLALVLAARLDWRFGAGPLVSQTFAQYLYVPEPQMLLVPTTAGLGFATRQVEPVVRETRSDALLVSLPAEDDASFAFATWRRRETAWVWPLSLWLHSFAETWLVPSSSNEDSFGFRLQGSLHHPEPVPWSDPRERLAGHRRAHAWLTEAAPIRATD